MQLKQELHNLQKNKMNINDYSTKVKNFAYVPTSIGALIDDEDLVVMTLNGFGKDYIANFVFQLQFEKHFPIFKTS
jgi:hypothetical protein